ncbi:MAG: ATP-binding cassette domain-containing protein, partial [Dietzia sp.]
VSAGEFLVDIDISLTADDGPVVALYGPSGSGKSLTLALIAGLLRPDRGIVRLGDRVVADAENALHVSTQDRRLGMVFQDALLLPHRTAVDNVALAVRGGRKSARRARALEELDRVGASHRANSEPATLSGGERQRVALARALAGTPDLLLLDEPLSALDHHTRLELRTVLREVITQSGTPTLIVSHDPDEVRSLADSAVVYQPGKTVRTLPISDFDPRSDPTRE